MSTATPHDGTTPSRPTTPADLGLLDPALAAHPLAGFVAGLPKAELHVHHVGSASPEIVAGLAARHPGSVPTDLDELRSFFEFRDFAHFIDVYLAVVALVRTPEDVRFLTYEVARGLAAQQVRYAELTCTPYTSVLPYRPGEGMSAQAYTEAIEDARVAAERDLGVVLRWIYDVPGEAGVRAADATLAMAMDHRVDALVGFGLGGPEIGVPRPQFARHFTQALNEGLHSVPHAGETTGPETVWHALRDLGAERIGHGTSSAQDPELLAHLAATGVPLEVCPSSNVATRAVTDLAAHPLKTFVDAGVRVTINSDDPPMFNTTLNQEYLVAADLLGLDEAGLADLARAAVDASFAPDDVRARVLAEIDDYAGPTAD
ncbi:adenosine deaminase [Nocardioides bruguierae]|uniref:Adenosine deaminase n=1 Tax=Nocardioides bruguierae TaxID=2945102 RepID=A0A9X2IEL4_9ACTN|nr:adenosine deaminase [Nocardioides bruguierae]MCM0620422.1 adenosine deaminase [Nocardioides bruguierae]